MEVEQEVVNFIANICTYCVPSAIIIGLCEKMINWFIRCATGKES